MTGASSRWALTVSWRGASQEQEKEYFLPDFE
jgi:hypothetical protein